MPITRTAMIDDDGSGTTGTILNNAWKQELYNQVDAFVPISPVTKLCYGVNTNESLVNDYYHNYRAPAGDTHVIWSLAPTKIVGITGFQEEPQGTMHLLINIAGFAIYLYHQNAGSTANNRIICPDYTDPFILQPWRAVWMTWGLFNNWMLLKA
jgi:hypothetical protein